MTVGPIDHLTLDAVVAYADGEMSMVSYQRAAAHVALCPQCDAEVRAQMTARSWLRAAADAPAMPTALLDTLRSIPVALPSTCPDSHPGSDRVRNERLAGPMPAHDRAVQRHRRFRFLGAGALVAGLTVGALVGVEQSSDPEPHPDSSQVAHLSPANAPRAATAGWGNP